MFFKISLLLFLLSAVAFGSDTAEIREKNYTVFADSLKINSQYRVTGKDGSQFEGILTGQDSNKIIVRNKSGKEFNIFRSEIDRIKGSHGNIIYQAAEIIEEEVIQPADKINIQNDTTQKCDIYLTSSTLLKNVMITGVTDSNFKVLKNDYTRDFNITGINKIKFINHGFGAGLVYGELASVLFWGILGLAEGGGGHPDYFGKGAGFVIGFILGIPTGLVAGFVSEFLTKDDEYDFTKINANVKANRLRYLIHKYKE